MRYIFFLLVVALAQSSFAVEPDKTVCIAPAAKGGGLDLTCSLVEEALYSTGLIDDEMTRQNMPGGIGTIAFNRVAKMRRNISNTIVAVSAGSALNIAQGKFGSYGEEDVRWLGAVAVDYGAVIVRTDSRWQNLKDLMDDLKKSPQSILFGGGGSIGSQDWTKIAMLASSAGIDSKNVRYVSYEGGGEALTALYRKRIEVVTGDVSEFLDNPHRDKMRVLAVLSEYRLNDRMAETPTAREQGVDVTWPIWRGFYMAPQVPDTDYNWWVNTLRRLARTEKFNAMLKERGLSPFFIFGRDFEHYVRNQIKQYKQLAVKEGLID